MKHFTSIPFAKVTQKTIRKWAISLRHALQSYTRSLEKFLEAAVKTLGRGSLFLKSRFLPQKSDQNEEFKITAPFHLADSLKEPIYQVS